MKQTLSQLAEQGVMYAVVRIDETKYWDKGIADKAGKIEGVYLVDLTKPTNLCSFEVNYPAECVRNFFHNTDGFDEYELMNMEYIEGADGYPYFLQSDCFEVAKTYTEGEYSEARENERCNPCVC